ncbi:hypothetical protein EJ04DRAFT_538981 [Polyplosphaeria fusca]|uniref:Uncharacterized protein n=1 Tax=Polyplosphaeria fusca TaxID=682080 RepID=A0A9P4QLW4_9PLEO|nr:hypothetical protein EJ04DRAFT_538981 [Polyplosphaeria fusca]
MSAALPTAPEPTIPDPSPASLTLRQPSSPPTSSPIQPPPLAWFEGTWNVTHSSLPLWKKNKNVSITYTRIPGTSPPHIDDLIHFTPNAGTKLRSVHGVDKPFTPGSGSMVEGKQEGEGGGDGKEERASLAYQWRGKGWLMVAASKWEVLGYGEEEGTGVEWVVTYFLKTVFTPAGVDIMVRGGRLGKGMVERIKKGVEGLGGEVGRQVGGLFEVGFD